MPVSYYSTFGTQIPVCLKTLSPVITNFTKQNYYLSHFTMSYKEGIVEAITELKDRTGSSMIAIKKYMQDKLPKDKKWQNAIFLKTLKAGVEKGDFIKNKNSYKLSADFKKKATKAAKDAAKPKKAAPKKKAATKKKTTAKKTATKKTTTKKTTTAAKKTTTAKKTTAKKPAAKKDTTDKKPAAKKATTAKKPAAKKASTTKKPAAKKTATKKVRIYFLDYFPPMSCAVSVLICVSAIGALRLTPDTDT